MRHILFVSAFLIKVFCNAQTDHENQEKYWKYREMLKNKFVKIGPFLGESIPMACRIPGYAYGGTPDPTGTQLQWKDATITLGYYIVVLATEYKLLKNSDQGIEPTLNELYYALAAINRLDLNAELYLSSGCNTATPDDLNGFFLRDDVPYNFWQNWENDGPLYPNLLDDPNIPDDIGDPGSPNRSDSDFNGLNDSNGN
jgi:hypothetical protein